MVKSPWGDVHYTGTRPTVDSVAKPNGDTYSFRGEIHGELLNEPKGGKGFGYDPLFYVKEYEKTFAELGDIKNKISHRAKALEKLQKELHNIFK